MKNRMIFALAIVLGLVAVPAMAALHEPIGADMRLNLRHNSTTYVTMSGSLLCRMPDSNNGEACQLRIQDNMTGRVFNLTNVTNAMRLYNSGVKNVAIEGRITNPDTVAVNEIRPFEVE